MLNGLPVRHVELVEVPAKRRGNLVRFDTVAFPAHAPELPHDHPSRLVLERRGSRTDEVDAAILPSAIRAVYVPGEELEVEPRLPRRNRDLGIRSPGSS
jgi:hypothetical protein